VYVKPMVATGQGFALLAADPLPDLLALCFVSVNDKMLAHGFGRLVIDLQTSGTVRNWPIANECDEPPFLRESAQGDVSVFHRDIHLDLAVIPTEMLAKERTEIE